MQQIFKCTLDYILQCIMEANIRSSLIRVHIVCNIGYKSTSADERADDICSELRKKIKPFLHSFVSDK